MTEQNGRSSRSFRVGFWVITALCAALYILLARDRYVWADEAYTFAMLRHDCGEIARITAADVHPPLFYFLLKFVTRPFGYGVAAAKLACVLPCVLTVMFGGVQLRRLFGERTALLFMCLYALYPFSMMNAAEVRMYTLAGWCVFASAVYGYRCFVRPARRDWALLTLCVCAAAYTHYYALVSAGIVLGLLGLACLLKRDWRRLGCTAASAAAALVLYLPWMGAFFRQLAEKVHNSYWIGPITLSTLAEYVKSVFGVNGITALSALFLLAYAAAAVQVLRQGRRGPLLPCICCLLIPAGTAAVGVAASLLVRPVFVIRYIQPAIALMAAFMALALGQWEGDKRLAAAILAVCVLCGAASAGVQLHRIGADTEAEENSAFAGQYGDVDCCVADTSSWNVPQVLAYYMPDTPVFGKMAMGAAACPYEQLRPLEQFDLDRADSAVLLVDQGAPVPERYTARCDAAFIRTLRLGCEPVDAYLLTPRQNSE